MDGYPAHHGEDDQQHCQRKYHFTSPLAPFGLIVHSYPASPSRNLWQLSPLPPRRRACRSPRRLARVRSGLRQWWPGLPPPFASAEQAAGSSPTAPTGRCDNPSRSRTRQAPRAVREHQPLPGGSSTPRACRTAAGPRLPARRQASQACRLPAARPRARAATRPYRRTSPRGPSPVIHARTHRVRLRSMSTAAVRAATRPRNVREIRQESAQQLCRCSMFRRSGLRLRLSRRHSRPSSSACRARAGRALARLDGRPGSVVRALTRRSALLLGGSRRW